MTNIDPHLASGHAGEDVQEHLPFFMSFAWDALKTVVFGFMVAFVIEVIKALREDGDA